MNIEQMLRDAIERKTAKILKVVLHHTMVI